MAKKNPAAPAAPRRRSIATAPRRTAARKAPTDVPPDPTFDEIAEAAYHRYLKRGGHHGTDFDDWVEAERELRSHRKPNSQ